MRPRIFVSIASYRDPFLPFTIRSLIDRARHPERLTFGICWQADESESLEGLLDERFRVRRYPYYASAGYGWARADIQKLYDGEPYHLLIDSHTHMARDWDERAIAQLEGKPGNPVLTTSSPPFTFDEQGRVVLPWAGTELDGVPLMRCEQDRTGLLAIQMSNRRKSERHQQTALLCCNFVFAPGRWILDVPEDPGMINACHEAPLAARSFTHGYDLYLPDEIVAWHLDYANYPGGHRRRVWEAKHHSWQDEQTRRMIERMGALIYGKGDPASLGRYGLGAARGLDQWLHLAGLDLQEVEDLP